MIEDSQPLSGQRAVLVTDGNERAALAVTRGLGQAGIPVIVAAETKRSLAGASRYCKGQWCYPSPLAEPEKFIDSMKSAMQVHEIARIMSITDATTQLLVDKKEEFGEAGAALPPAAAYHLVSDKYRLMQLAKQLDVPIPDTVFVPDGNVQAVADSIREYPVVVKPGRSLLQVDGTWAKTGVHIVSSRHELTELYGQKLYLGHPSLIQQRIEGSGEGIFGLFRGGKPCALFAHRRIREKPPSGGVSVFRESIALPKPMTDYAIRLMEYVKWDGVAMVEFKTDSRTGMSMLMEVNGRFWGSLQLAIDAGLNFPHLLHRMAQGAEVSVPETAYRRGTKSRWLLGDLDHLLLRLIKSRKELALGTNAPPRWRCIVDFMKLYQHDLHFEVERWNDPGPAWVEYRSWLGALMGIAA